MKRHLSQPYFFVPATLILALLLELLLFNFRHFETLFCTPVQNVTVTLEHMEQGSDGICTLTQGEWEAACIHLTGFDEAVRYLYLDLTFYDENGNVKPSQIMIDGMDEGNTNLYTMGGTSFYPSLESTKYIRLHPDGNLRGLRINLTYHKPLPARVAVGDIIVNARVPLFFSFKRLFTLWALLLVLWMMRPGSALYRIRLDFGAKRQIAAILIVLCVCLLGGLFLGRFNRHHGDSIIQYHHLAESLAKGQFHVDFEVDERLAELENPYDYFLRMQMEIDYPWDYSYYDGKYYVYFGLTPELLFFLPYYLATGQPFDKVLAQMICIEVMIAAIFWLVAGICRRWFRETSIGTYFLSCLVALTSCGIWYYLMTPAQLFYSLPIVTGMALGVTGLAFWVSASVSWSRLADAGETKRRPAAVIAKLAAGSLLIALVAGTRPQMLVCALLCIPVFAGLLKREWKPLKGQTVGRIIAFALPFVAVAALLMYYNAARFGSPFDFGVRYMLTRNDMGHHTADLARLTEGVYVYLLQPWSFGSQYPYIAPVQMNVFYLGRTIREAVYGGAFFLKPQLLLALTPLFMRQAYRAKKILSLTLIPLFGALLLAAADAAVAGIVYRYGGDFWWLLALPASVATLQLAEDRPAESLFRRRFVTALLAVCLFAFAAEFLIGVHQGLVNDTERFYYVKSLLP